MKVAILAEQNFSFIDGSTIWLLNVCRNLAAQPDMDVTLISRWAITSRVLADDLPESVTIIEPKDVSAALGEQLHALPIRHLSRAMEALEAKSGAFDRILIRGEPYLNRLLANPLFAHRVVAYTPNATPRINSRDPAWIAAGVRAGARLIVQSAPSKHVMEAFHDYPANLVHVAPPFASAAGSPAVRSPTGATTLCYSGKIDRLYGLDWLLDIAANVGGDPDLRLSIVAGKDTRRREHPKFFERFDDLRDTVRQGAAPSISLVQNLSHQDAKQVMSGADFAYCLRNEAYDDVIEISTKILEFIAMGVPPILNDNALNRSILGADYPYLIDTAEDAAGQVIAILRSTDAALRSRAGENLLAVRERYSADRASQALATAVRGYALGAELTSGDRNIHVASHEPKFIRQLEQRLCSEPGVTLARCWWPLADLPPKGAKRPFGVDTVFCEWCGSNAVWHSRNKNQGTKLIVRLHRFEAFRAYPKRVKWENVDALIVVSDYFRDLMIREFGVAPDRVHVFPQYIDWTELRRPKLPEARFTIGLVGINPYDHKRFDRAIDFLEALLDVDDRFTLAVRSVMPWEIDWLWNNLPEDKTRFVDLFQRIFADQRLSRAVRFDRPGRDMEEWYRGVGTILSSSETEGCHTSVMEGMASGCLPVVHDWPGARTLFEPFVHGDIRDAIPAVIAHSELGAPGFEAEIDTLRDALSVKVKQYDLEKFCEFFVNL